MTCGGSGRLVAMIGDDGSAVPTNLPDVHPSTSSTVVCARCKRPVTSGVIHNSRSFHEGCYMVDVLKGVQSTETKD